MMRILVVDDSNARRDETARLVAGVPELELVGCAGDGLEAVAQVKALKPDVVTVDLERSALDGIGALARIMSECPARVVMFSNLDAAGAQAALTALAMGACDVVAKDADLDGADLLRRIRAIGASKCAPRHRVKPLRSPLPEVRLSGRGVELALIGASTGGPPVLETVLKTIDYSISTPIVIAQQMPAAFTKAMAERLHSLCDLDVTLGADGMALSAGRVYIAPGGKRSRVVRSESGRWSLSVAEAADDRVEPSVDALFCSAAEAYGRGCLAIVLTGMGDDGLRGATALAEAGALVLAQDEASSVVYEMPGAVTRAGVATANLTPQALGSTLRKLCVRGSDALRATG